MKKILLKILLATSPILIILAVYFFNDPFKALYHYDTYYKEWDSSTIYITNSDVVATRTFIQNEPKYHYDSYILGASRAGFYFIDDWRKHIQGAYGYHFNAPNESLYGIEKKLKFIVHQKAALKNVLLIIDTGLLVRTTNDNDILYRKDPLVSGESSLRFQSLFIKSFFERHFLYAYFDHLFSGKIKRYMIRDKLIYRMFIHYRNDYNETALAAVDYRIRNYKERYYEERHRYFFTRDSVQHYAIPVIKDTQIAMLQNIKKIFDQEHTNYKIVISPLYDQVKISPQDMQRLLAIFGQGNVFDFSGINEITNNKYNYYEASHYRPLVCRKIMDSVYSQQL